MKIINHILLIFCIVALFSCYEDKGNYEYFDTGSVSVKIDMSKRIIYGDTLQIEPKIDFNVIEEKDVSFEWYLTDKTDNSEESEIISKEKNLFIEKFNHRVGDYILTLSIVNNSTDVKSFSYCGLTVDNGLGRAYLLLTKNEKGEYDIDGLSHPWGDIRKAQYSAVNGEKIFNAKKIVYVNSYSQKNDNLFVTKENDCLLLSPIDLAFQGDSKDLFFDMPTSINIMDICSSSRGDDYFLNNNGILHKINNKEQPFKASLPLILEGADYNITAVGEMRKSGGASSLAFFDNKNNRFLTWYVSWSASYLSTITKTGVFDSQAIPKNLELLKIIDGKEDRCYVLFKDKNNSEVFLYVYKDTAPYYTVNWTPSNVININAIDAVRILNATVFEPLKSEDRIYYAVDNKIYLYDVANNNSSLFYEDEDTSMVFSKIYYREIHDDEVTAAGNSSGKGTFFRFFVGYLGEILEVTEKLPEPILKYPGFDEIQDFTFKYKSY